MSDIYEKYKLCSITPCNPPYEQQYNVVNDSQWWRALISSNDYEESIVWYLCGELVDVTQQVQESIAKFNKRTTEFGAVARFDDLKSG